MLQQRLTRNLYTGQTEPLTAPLSFDFTEDLGDKRHLSLFSQGDFFLRPDGTTFYRRPDGTSLYKRPAS